MIMLVMIKVMMMIRLLVVLQRVLLFKPQTLAVSSYLGIVGGYCTDFMVVVVLVMIKVMMIIRLLVALQCVLEFKPQTSVINSYDGGVGIAGENPARLEGGSNIGRSDANEGKSDNATKSTELCKRVS